MAILEKLQQEIKQTKQNKNMIEFKNLVVVYLGVEPRDFYKKIKDNRGNNVVDENGKQIREEAPSGLTYTFNEVGTSKIVKVVVQNKLNINLLEVYKISGLGFDIRQSSLIFIQENGSVSIYE